MSDDSLQDRLQQALGTAYVIERELGGGGMSRVFVAREPALDRLVVVKLLPAELTAGLSAERFRREIQLAARLQHPHIVPLLAAGTADGLLYYTMPFVEGSSLRARIAREGALPIADVVRLLREVSSALGYAHRQGLVHRDIKPDNVLLSGGHALVTDFGIAKALISGAAAQDPRATTSGATGLTTVGTAIGTPAYMAPEQGVGDPATDHRADLYALGVVAYEMLTGATPFGTRTTPHQLLMAHMVETPPPIEGRRPDIPPALAALVGRLLAKSPDERPATAEALVAELDALGSGALAAATPLAAGTTGAAAGTAAGTRTRASGRRRALMVAGALGVVAVTAAALLVGRREGGSVAADGAASAGAPAADRVMVLALANETGDPSLEPVGRMAADWLTRGLAQTGLVKLVDAQAAAVGPNGGAAAAPAGGSAAAIATARGLGAGTVVTGRYYKLGDSLYFQLRVVDAARGEIAAQLDPVSGPAANPTAALDRLNRTALGALATRFNPALADYARQGTRPPTYDAYQAYVAGHEALNRNDYAGALAKYQEAIRLDSNFVAPRLGVLEALENMGNVARADSAVTVLEQRRASMTPLEQASLDEYRTSVRGDIMGNLAAAFRMHALSPGGQYRATLATKLLSAGRAREALDTLEAGMAEVGIFQGRQTVPQLRVRILHELGEHERALEAARTLRKRFPADPALAMYEHTALAALGRTAELRALHDEILQIRGVGSLRTLRRHAAGEMEAHGHPKEARALLESVLASYDSMPPDSAKMEGAKLGRALTLSQLGRHAEAYALAKETVAPGDTSLGKAATIGLLAAWAGDRATAERVEARMAAQPTKHMKGAWHFQRARLRAALGDRARAVVLLREAQQQGTPVVLYVHGTPELRLLQGEPGFEALTRPRH